MCVGSLDKLSADTDNRLYVLALENKSKRYNLLGVRTQLHCPNGGFLVEAQ